MRRRRSAVAVTTLVSSEEPGEVDFDWAGRVEKPVVEEHEAESGEEGDVVEDDARQAVPLGVVRNVIVARMEPGGDQGGVLQEAERIVEQILVPVERECGMEVHNYQETIEINVSQTSRYFNCRGRRSFCIRSHLRAHFLSMLFSSPSTPPALYCAPSPSLTLTGLFHERRMLTKYLVCSSVVTWAVDFL